MISQSNEISLQSGLVYRIKYRALNVIGNSEFSEIIEVAMVSIPLAPSSPQKITSLSDESKLTVSWEAPAVLET